MASRQAEVARNTLETRISVGMDLDGSGKGVFQTGVSFLDHMLDQVARHGLIDLDVRAEGAGIRFPALQWLKRPALYLWLLVLLLAF